VHLHFPYQLPAFRRAFNGESSFAESILAVRTMSLLVARE